MVITAKTVESAKRVLLIGVIAAIGLHIATVLIDRYSGVEPLRRWFGYFDLDKEIVPPSVYTSLLLACAGVVAVILSLREKLQYRAVWWLLASGFFYLALDESLIIHERLAEPIRKLLAIGDTSLLYHAWVIPAIAVVVIGLLFSATAIWRHMINRQQAVIISLVLTLVIVDVVIESVGTRFYGEQLLYRLGPVLLEEGYELVMISYILHRLLSFAATKQRSKPARTGRIRGSLSSVSR